MTSKITPSNIKQFIVNLVNTQPAIAEELETLRDEGFDETNPSRWIRTHKSSAKNVHDLPYSLDDSLWQELANGGWSSSIDDPSTLIPGVHRQFSLKNTDGEVIDATFMIFTGKDDRVITWWCFNLD